MSNQETLERKLLRLATKELLRRLEDPDVAADLSAAELSLAIKVSTDAGVTIGDIQSGDFGQFAKDALQSVSEKLPFDVDSMPEVH